MVKQPGFYNGVVGKIHRLVSLVMGIIMGVAFLVQILFSIDVIHTSNDAFWQQILKRISATALVIVLLFNQPHYIQMLWVGINMVIKPFDPQTYMSNSIDSPPDYASESQPMNKTSINNIEGRKEWLKTHYPWVDIYGNMYRNFENKYRQKRSPKFFTLLSLLFNAGCIIQYLVCATVAWPPYQLISNKTYGTLQTLSIVTQIVPSVLVFIIWKRYQKYLALGELFPWA